MPLRFQITPGGAAPSSNLSPGQQEHMTMHTNLDASSFSDLHRAAPISCLAPALQALPFFRPVMPLHITRIWNILPINQQYQTTPQATRTLFPPYHSHSLALRLPDNVQSPFRCTPIVTPIDPDLAARCVSKLVTTQDQFGTHQQISAGQTVSNLVTILTQIHTGNRRQVN